MISRGYSPIRTCLGCRSRLEKRLLERFVFSSFDGLVWDRRKRMKGRGAYVCRRRSCLERAMHMRGFERSLRVRLNSSDLVSKLHRGGFFDAEDQSV